MQNLYIYIYKGLDFEIIGCVVINQVISVVWCKMFDFMKKKFRILDILFLFVEFEFVGDQNFLCIIRIKCKNLI